MIVPERPCVGCGFCCTTAPCEASYQYYQRDMGHCPALYWADGRYWCELAHDYPHVLHIGAGCCQPLFNTDRLELIRVREHIG